MCLPLSSEKTNESISWTEMCFALAKISKCPKGKVLGGSHRKQSRRDCPNRKALSRFKLIANVCQVIRPNLPNSSGVAGPVGCSSNTAESGFKSGVCLTHGLAMLMAVASLTEATAMNNAKPNHNPSPSPSPSPSPNHSPTVSESGMYA